MQNKYWEVLNKEGESSADILIYGDIGGFDWNTYQEINTAQLFRADFKALEEEYSLINVHINSYGGLVSEGLAISNIIKASKVEVHTYIDGVAMSMAALIALSGKKIHMASNGILMLHNASGYGWGNANDFRETASALDTYDRSLALMIVALTGKSEADVFAEYLNYKDNYFNADQALEHGLISVIDDYEAEATPTVEAIKAEGYLKVAARKMDMLKDPAAREKFLVAAKSRVTPKPQIMNFQTLKEAIASGKFAQLSPEETASINDEISAALKEGDVITAADLQKVQDEAASASDALSKVQAALGADAGADLSALITGKLTELSEATAKLEKLAPPAPTATGEDKEDTKDSMAELDNLPHNRKADSAAKSGSIYN